MGVFLVALSTACIGGTNPVADEAVALSPTSAAPTVDPALDRAPLTRGLPRYATNYFRWTRLNAVPLRRAAIPHGEAKRVYVNRSREVVTSLNRRGGDYPDGTVVVKTGAEDGDRASIVAIMRKVAGADPARGDWQYPEFERKAPGGRYILRGAGQPCWTCHAGAADQDWVFTELDPLTVPGF